MILRKNCVFAPKWGQKMAFLAKIRPYNSSTTKIYVMWYILGCGHLLTPSMQEVRKKSSDQFLRKLPKTAKNGQKWPKMAIFGVSRDYFWNFWIFPDIPVPWGHGHSQVTLHVWKLEKSIVAINQTQGSCIFGANVKKTSYTIGFQSSDWKS